MRRLVLAPLLVAAAASVTISAEPVEPPAAFSRCHTCHATARNAPHGLGNTLFGIYGRRAGSMPDFDYSPAMAASGIVWDAATLDAYIADPAAVVPGTRMSRAKMADPAKRAEIVAYLKTLR